MFKKTAEEFVHGKRQKLIMDRIAAIGKDLTLSASGVYSDSIAVAGMESKDTEDTSAFSYDYVEGGEMKYSVVDLECLALNPASTVAVCKILDKLLEIKQKQNLNFLPVYMDGSPHTICQKVLQEKLTCSECGAEFTTKDNHGEEMHMKPTRDISLRKYDGLIVRPGCGHIEMMIVKSILNTFWEPFIRPIAQRTGYSSEAALDYCRKGGDHHKSWEMLM